MKNDLDAVVVIPSYREGTNVVHTLASLARQKGIKDLRLGALVVVNNIRTATEEVLRQNKETAELVRVLAQGKVPTLSGDKKKFRSLDPTFDSFGAVSISEAEAAQQIVQAPFLNVDEVNLWEGDNAPEVCNVGVARDIGTKEALKHLKNPSCPIMHRDADTLLHPNDVATIINLFRENPAMNIVRGSIHEFLPVGADAESAAHRRQLYSYKVDYFLNRLRILLSDEKSGTSDFTTNGKERSKHPIKLNKQGQLMVGVPMHETEMALNGCDMNFRGSLYELFQFPHITGEEDTRFGKAVKDGGHTINYDSRLKVAVRARFSERATTGHGQTLLKYSKNGVGSYDFPSIQASKFFIDMWDLVMNKMAIHPNHRIEDFFRVMGNSGITQRYGLTDEDLNVLWKKYIFRDARNNVAGLSKGMLAEFGPEKFPNSIKGTLEEMMVELERFKKIKGVKELLAEIKRHYALMDKMDGVA